MNVARTILPLVWALLLLQCSSAFAAATQHAAGPPEALLHQYYRRALKLVADTSETYHWGTGKVCLLLAALLVHAATQPLRPDRRRSCDAPTMTAVPRSTCTVTTPAAAITAAARP